MDIQTEFCKRKLLKNNTGAYDLTKCRWKSVNNQHGKKKQITNPSTQGYMHASTILKNSLYVIAGIDENFQKQSMHSYNFKTYEWKHWKDCVLPPYRDSFGLTTHKNEIYLFGGSTNDRDYGDIHIFSNFTSNWREYQGSSPSPRTPMIFTDVDNQFILLYGGANFETETILEDAHIFYQGQWKALSITNAPSGLIGAQSAVCGENVYIFGGELQAPSGPATPNHQLYKLVINPEEMSLQFVAIEVRGRSSPSCRTAHSIVGLDKEYFILLGGISLEQNTKNQILRDIWLFDTEQMNWTNLNPVNGIVKGVASGSLTFKGNALILLGGSVQRLDIWNEQLMMIQFTEDEFFKAEICSNCQMRATQRQKQQKSFPKSLVLSAGFFYNLSLQYKHPFQAITAIYESSTVFHAQNFRIGINKEINENEFIEIGWDGRSLSRQQFQHLICHSETKDKFFNRFVNVLKLASLRFGKTMLFCSNDKKQRKVFLFSADSKVIPEFDDIYGYFAYVENIEKNTIESHEGRMNKKLILNVLHSRLSDPNDYLTKSGNYILVFQKNILVTSQKIYYYELISSTVDDITVFRNLKKIQFLDELGYSMSKEPEVSLTSYVAVFNFQRSLPAFYINSSAIPVQAIDYLGILKNMEENAKVRTVQVRGGSGDVEFESWLYIAEQSDVIVNNFGVMIYFQGMLVNRLDVQFGQLFKQLFYKTKFKSALTTFEFMGVINIKRGLQLTFLRNDFRRDKAYFEFIDLIRGAMKKGSIQKMNKRARISSDDIEQRK